jgi:hypothetical protein
MTLHDAGDLARRLAENAEAVCRQYLSAGRRHGNYWLVGDLRTPGRSLYVRLHGGPANGGRENGRMAQSANMATCST